MNFYDWLDARNFELDVKRYPNQKGRWSASIPNCEVSERECFLVGAYGNGTTPELAAADYAKKLQGQLIVINAYKDNREEITVPDELTL